MFLSFLWGICVSWFVSLFSSNVMHNWVGIDVDGGELCSLIVAWGMEMMNETRFMFCQFPIIVKKT